jgi:hypothetical protein
MGHMAHQAIANIANADKLDRTLSSDEEDLLGVTFHFWRLHFYFVSTSDRQIIFYTVLIVI